MSNEAVPSESTPSEILDLLDAQNLDALRRMLEEGGTKTIRHKCSTCGHTDTFDVKTDLDVEARIKLFSAVSSAKARRRDDEGDVAREGVKIHADFSEMTTAELCEYAARLRRELAADDGEA